MSLLKHGPIPTTKEGELIHQIVEWLLKFSEEKDNHYYVKTYITPITKQYVADELVDKFKELPPHIAITFHIGGYKGGNCWDSGNPEYEISGHTPDLDWLAKLINNFKPDLPLNKYLEIKAKVKECNITEQEYYGNTSEYLCQYILLQDVLDIIIN